MKKLEIHYKNGNYIQQNVYDAEVEDDMLYVSSPHWSGIAELTALNTMYMIGVCLDGECIYNCNYDIWVAEREAGNLITKVESIEEGLRVIEEYEYIDKKEGTYKPNFYSVVRSDTREDLI